MNVNRIDHLVLTVKDIELTCEFYSKVLGMEIVTFREGRKALVFGEQKLNLHEDGKGFEPKALKPTPGSIDLCFITTTSLEQAIKHFDSMGVKVVEGPVKRTGAYGVINSVYIKDPDGNLLEISNYLDSLSRS